MILFKRGDDLINMFAPKPPKYVDWAATGPLVVSGLADNIYLLGIAEALYFPSVTVSRKLRSGFGNFGVRMPLVLLPCASGRPRFLSGFTSSDLVTCDTSRQQVSGIDRRRILKKVAMEGEI